MKVPKLVSLLCGLTCVLSACSAQEASTDTSAASAPSASVAKDAPLVATTAAAKDGWWIKVRREKQESPTITLSIGSNNHTVEAWKTWNSGDPLEFDVPDKFKNINPLYIKAQSSGGRNSWFCMMYRGDGVKHFDVDDDEDHEEKQSNRDGECNFNN
jgi:hypothetical protein